MEIEVVGNGLVATSFKKVLVNRPTLLFASGVSNSLETSEKSFNREINLLDSVIKSKRLLLYFSSFSVTYKKSPYTDHKLRIEKFITENCDNYLILRLTNIVGKSSNKNTLLNYLINKVFHSEKFDLYINAQRNFLDIDDVVSISKELLEDPINHNKILNIGFPENINMLEVINQIQIFLEKKAIFNSIMDIHETIGNNFLEVNTFSQINSNKKKYLSSLLRKYY